MNGSIQSIQNEDELTSIGNELERLKELHDNTIDDLQRVKIRDRILQCAVAMDTYCAKNMGLIHDVSRGRN